MSKNLRDLQNQYHAGPKATSNSSSLSTLEAYAAPLVHDKCFEICKSFIDSHKNGKEIKVLILGAGSGYFDQRLLDAGFKNIDAVEYIPDHYKVRGTSLYSYDLNLPWASKLLIKNGNRKYDLIIAIEVIEHLENPFFLMREVSSLMLEVDELLSNNKTSMLLLTSPNVTSSFSRFRFLLTGYLEYFGNTELQGTGHISPMIDHIFQLNLKLANLKIVNNNTNRNVWHARISESKGRKKIFIYLLYILARITIYKSDKEGEINIYSIIKV